MFFLFQTGDVCISILHPPVNDPHSGELPSERWNPTQSVRSVGSLRFHLETAKIIIEISIYLNSIATFVFVESQVSSNGSFEH